MPRVRQGDEVKEFIASNGPPDRMSNGWRLICCKSPNGEQLKFVQALGPVRQVFDAAREARRKAT